MSFLFFVENDMLKLCIRLRFAVVDRVLMNTWHISDTVINPELSGNVRGKYLKFEPHKS